MNHIYRRGIAAGIVRKFQRLKKNAEGLITAFDIERDRVEDYIGMAVENAGPGETVVYI